jgi:IPT/TIG domain/PASTA domain
MPKRAAISIALVALSCLAIPVVAEAQETIGQLSPPSPGSEFHAASDIWQASAAPGVSYTVPSAGLITSWSTNAGPEPGQLLSFKILRPLGSEHFTVVGHDGPRPLSFGALNTFKTGIPVQAGDILALGAKNADAVPSAALFTTGNGADEFSGMGGDAADGAAVAQVEADTQVRLNVTATLLLPPVISALSPASGSVRGGSTVTISGSNFAEVRGVSFGAVPAERFTVDSESQISAVAPPGGTLSPVTVALTTAAGSATGAFAYEGCRVPRLKNLTPKGAKRKLRMAGCRLGKVKTAISGARGSGIPVSIVKRQSPKPGTVLAPGAKVSLTVSRGATGRWG